jgi:hypothetical protein
MAKIFLYIFKLFCLFGCLFQVSKIIKFYLSYETITEAKYETETIISLPAITLCASKSLFIKEEFYLKYFPNGKASIREVEGILNKMKIKDQFEALHSTKEVSKMIGCTVMQTMAFNISNILNITNRLKCEEISAVRISINFERCCFTLFSQMNGESDDRYLIDYDVSTRHFEKSLVKIYIPFGSTTSLFYFHSRIESVTEDFRPYPYTLNIQSERQSIIRFKKIRVELMSKPYKTSCFDYKNIGYYSRADCIFKCKVGNYAKNQSEWPAKFYTDDRRSDLVMNESSYNSMEFELSDKCRELCGESKDCFAENYELSEIRSYGENGLFTIVIPLPTIPTLIFTHWPKIRFEEFLCFIGSIFSLWFGFSIVMLSDVCLLVVKQVKNVTNKFNTKVTQNNLIINNSFQMERIRNRKNFQQKRRFNKNLF